MKNYKEFEKMSIGSSDIAEVVVRSLHNLNTLRFGEDGVYSAYIVPADIDIPIHYKKELEGTHWLKIYDDTRMTFSVQCDRFEIYRSGNFGCIIKLFNCERNILQQ